MVDCRFLDFLARPQEVTPNIWTWVTGFALQKLQLGGSNRLETFDPNKRANVRTPAIPELRGSPISKKPTKILDVILGET